MIANFAAMDIRPGSMGRPLPGHRGGDRPATSRTAASRWSTSRTSQGELALRPGWPSMFRGYSDEPERYAKCFARRLVPHRRPRPARRRRLLLVRRPRRRRDQDLRPPDRPVRGGERAARAPGRRRGRRDRQARPGGRRDRQGVRRAQARATSRRARARARAARASRASRLGAVVAPKEIEFADDVPQTRSGKIMRRLLKARELGLPEGDTSTLEERRDDRRRQPKRPRSTATHALALLREMLRIRRFEEKAAELYSARARSAASSTSTSARRRWRSARCRRSAPDDAHRRDLPRARPRARARAPAGRADGRDVRQGERLQPRPRRLDALLRRVAPLLRRLRDRRRRAADRGRAGAGRQDAGARVA